MIHLAICDDCSVFREETKRSIYHLFPDKAIDVQVMENGKALLQQYQQEKRFDIILLDIEMPGENGIEIAEKIRSEDRDCILIFISSHSSYVFSAFEVNAFRYLLKPLTEEKLKEELTYAMEQYCNMHEFYAVQGCSSMLTIKIRDIRYLEVCNHTVYIHAMGESIEMRGRLEEEAKKLSPYGFISPHRSYLVNPYFIKEIAELNLIMRNGEKIKISRSCRQTVMDQYQAYLMKYGV